MSRSLRHWPRIEGRHNYYNYNNGSRGVEDIYRTSGT